MVSASTRTAAADPLASLTTDASRAKKTANSFAQQLATEVGTHLKNPADTSRASVNVSQGKGQSSGGSQFLVAARPGPAKPSSAAEEEIPTMLGMGPVESKAPATSKSSAPAGIPTMLGMGPAEGTAPVTTPVSTPISGAIITTKAPVALATDPVPVASSPTETEADAYWAAQPAAVQALRNMPDSEAKDKLALSLANQGYSIDTQIMVWGWDPQMTMQVRENQGYSWVPSYGQSNIPIGPGLSMPGVPSSYSPNSPPPGSIGVTTAFAIGTIQNPLVQVDPTTT